MIIRRNNTQTRGLFPVNAEDLARGMVGLRYEVGGRSKDGIDCLGLLLRWFNDLGFRVEDPFDCDPETIWRTSFPKFFVKTEKPEFGDAVHFEKDGTTHLGFLVFDGMIHATEAYGTIISRIPTSAGFWRHREICRLLSAK